MNKKVMLEQLEHGILLLKKYSILTIGLFIVGFPGETENTVQDTVAFIQRLKPDFILLSRGSIIETLRFINSVRYMAERRNAQLEPQHNEFLTGCSSDRFRPKTDYRFHLHEPFAISLCISTA